MLPVWVSLLESLLSSGKVPFPAGCGLPAPAGAGRTPPSQPFSCRHRSHTPSRCLCCVGWRLAAAAAPGLRGCCRGCCRGCRRLGAAKRRQEPAHPWEMDVPPAWKKPSQGKCRPSPRAVLVPRCIFNNIPELQAVFSMNQAFISCAR